MAHSFFTGTDEQLYNGSAVFSALINLAPEAYGLVESQAVEYAALNASYAAAYRAAVAPAQRTKSTICDKNDAGARLRARASELAKIIRGTAGQKLSLGLNVRAMPSPLPPPGKPDRFRVTLSCDGSVGLGWTCQNPPGSRGTIYHVWRRVSGERAFTFLGASGTKRFVDTTIPAGTTSITYQVQAIRSKKVGLPAQYNVSFGMSTGAAMAAPAAATAPKMAA